MLGATTRCTCTDPQEFSSGRKQSCTHLQLYPQCVPCYEKTGACFWLLPGLELLLSVRGNPASLKQSAWILKREIRGLLCYETAYWARMWWVCFSRLFSCSRLINPLLIGFVRPVTGHASMPFWEVPGLRYFKLPSLIASWSLATLFEFCFCNLDVIFHFYVWHWRKILDWPILSWPNSLPHEESRSLWHQWEEN